LVCWCGASAEYINAASDATPEHPCCAEHTKDGYRAIETSEARDRIDPYNGETDKHYRRAGCLHRYCACGERWTDEHLASLEEREERATHAVTVSVALDITEMGEDAPRTFHDAARIVLSTVDAPLPAGAIAPIRAELVNGCNLEACLRYAHERIAALESERDALRASVERWRSHALDVETELNARIESEQAELRQEREIQRAQERADARARSNARARRTGR
jgi:hypothetical protein